VRRRTLQYTSAGRAAFVLPAVAYVARNEAKPLSLIDIGCSAGLLTSFDRYAYDFGPDGRLGGPSDLTITSFRFAGGKPAFLTGIPKIAARVGVDLNPIDPADPREYRWIDALCPPDMVEERRQLRAALTFRARNSLRVIAGDALAELPALFATMADPICALATHCLYQWPADARDALDRRFRGASEGRTIYFITIDHPAALDRTRVPEFASIADGEVPMVHEATLRTYRDGEFEETLLGRYDSWGRRGIWLAA
jgi:hypothetical protein